MKTLTTTTKKEIADNIFKQLIDSSECQAWNLDATIYFTSEIGETNIDFAIETDDSLDYRGWIGNDEVTFTKPQEKAMEKVLRDKVEELNTEPETDDYDVREHGLYSFGY